MTPRRSLAASSRRGMAYIVSLLLLSVFAALAAAMATTTNLAALSSRNHQRVLSARLTAEGGLAWAAYALRDVQSEGYWTGTPDILSLVYDHLVDKLPGVPISIHDSDDDGTNDVVVVAARPLPGDRSFSFSLTRLDGMTLRLTVVGQADECTRSLAVGYQINESTKVLSYSVASRSRIIMTDGVVVDGDVCSTWDRTYISGYDIPPVLMEPDTEVVGDVKTVLTEEEFNEDDCGDYLEGEYEELGFEEPAFGKYATEDFDTSDYQTGTSDITTITSPDYTLPNDPFPSATNIRRCLERPVYENRTFDNVYVPVGLNPKFINCTFNQVIYVDTNETNTLDQWSHYYYSEHAIPGKEYRSADRYNDDSNNVVFENCTFNGPLITAVPRDYWWSKNALTFEGTTTFTNTHMPESTILAPNFGVDIGGRGYDEEENPDSMLTGVIVGGIVDIRGTANIEGTILSMYYPDTDRGSAARYYGTNLGCYDDGGETSGATGWPGNIRIVPDPDNILPMGIRKRYTITLVPGTYEEL